MSFESQLKPSPMVHHSTPGLLAERSSPTFHLPHFMNWTTQTRQTRAIARIAVPKAAVDLPLPPPALTMTTDGALTRPLGGGSRGGRLPVTSSPPVSVWLRPRSAPARPVVVDGDDLGSCADCEQHLGRSGGEQHDVAGPLRQRDGRTIGTLDRHREAGTGRRRLGRCSSCPASAQEGCARGGKEWSYAFGLAFTRRRIHSGDQ